jgi:hypothetical protein
LEVQRKPSLPHAHQIFYLQTLARERLQGSKPIDLKSFLYHWKDLKCECLKWTCITHLDIWNTSYGQKKGRESNWQFDSRPLKVKNQPNFHVCRWRATYRWKALNEGYIFDLNLITIKGLHTKLWGTKVARVLTLVISRLPFGNPETKNHLDVGLMKRHRVYLSQPHFGAKCENATHTPKSGKMESFETSKNLEDDLKGQISSPWCILYINRKVLKRRCPRWPCMGHLDICSPSYGQKKGQESICQFDSRPLKVGNRPLPNVTSRSATRRWKALDES